MALKIGCCNEDTKIATPRGRPAWEDPLRGGPTWIRRKGRENYENPTLC